MWYYDDYTSRLAEKRRAEEDDLSLYSVDDDGRPLIHQDDALLALELETDSDHLDDGERQEAAADHPYWNESLGRPDCESTPDAVDHRQHQTRVKNQLLRGTCVCFASLAGIEAVEKRRSGNDLDLSEQYANWLFMGNQGRNLCADGLRTTLAARYLNAQGVCVEHQLPYEDKAQVNLHCNAAPPVAARAAADYGIGTYAIIDRLGGRGPSIANPAYLECILANGQDIVFGTHVAWGRPDANGVHDVIIDAYGNPLRSRGGHAMLIVGYDRSAAVPYFVCKNSWGDTKGVSGYYYLSYDYLIEYAKYGYLTLTIRTDMTAP